MIVEAVLLDSKTPTEVIDIDVDFRDLLLIAWASGKQKSTGAFVRPREPNGKEYECTAVTSPGSIGQTDTDEPVWPTTVGDVVVDGSVTWTCRAFGTSATDTISGQSASTSSGLTLGSVTASGTTLAVRASLGVAGKDYDIVCQITTAGGQTLEQTVILPVRYHKRC